MLNTILQNPRQEKAGLPKAHLKAAGWLLLRHDSIEDKIGLAAVVMGMHTYRSPGNQSSFENTVDAVKEHSGRKFLLSTLERRKDCASISLKTIFIYKFRFISHKIIHKSATEQKRIDTYFVFLHDNMKI